MNIYKRFIALFISILFILQYSAMPIFATSTNEPATFTSEPTASLELATPSAVLIDAKTGIPIYEKNKDEKNFPASITKVMTALLTLEKYSDNLDKKINFSEEAVYSIPYNSSNIAMNDGETLTVEQCLYAIMLASANEVANALAEDISGNNVAFGKLMTEKAKSIGATNTNFLNPHGLHDVNHYTTANDMALIMKEAIQYPEFIEVISTIQTELPPTEKQPEPRPLNNSHKMIIPGTNYYYEYAIGGKTGFTDEAQHTLVTYAKKDGIELIAVVMHDEKGLAYTDTIKMFDYGFTQFETTELLNRNNYKTTIPVIGENGETQNLTLVADKSVHMDLPKSAIKDIKIEDNLPETLSGNINSGDIVGQTSIKYKDITLETVDLLAETSVVFQPIPTTETSENEEPQISIISILGKIIAISVVITISLIALRMLMIHKRKKQRMARYRIEKSHKTTYRYKNNY